MKSLIIITLVIGLMGCGARQYPPSRLTNEIVESQQKCIDHGGIQEYTMDTTRNAWEGPITHVTCRDEHVEKIVNQNGK